MATFKAPRIDRSQLPEEYAGGGEVTIDSPEQLERAVQAIRWLSSASVSIDEALTQQTMPLQEQAEKLKQLDVDGMKVAFSEQLKALEEAVAEYVLKNKRTVFEGDSQTARLQHGEVCMKSSAPGITFGRLSKAERTTKMAESFSKAITELTTTVAAKLGLRPWWRFKPELDLQAIKAAYKNKELTDDQLKEHGLKYGKTTKVTVKPYA